MADEIKLTLSNPKGETEERTYSVEQWQNMLENIQSQCDDHFENGPSELREAYTSFIQLGLNVVAQSGSRSSGKQSNS